MIAEKTLAHEVAIHAKVGAPHSLADDCNFSFSPWTAVQTPLFTDFIRLLPATSTSADFFRAESELRNLLTAIFLATNTPLPVFGYSYNGGITQEVLHNLDLALGSNQVNSLSDETIAAEMLAKFGKVERADYKLHDHKNLALWYRILNDNPDIATSMHLLANVFLRLHARHSHNSIAEFASISTDLLNVLEILITYKLESSVDEVLGLEVLGCVMWDEIFADSDARNEEKGRFNFTQVEFRRLLTLLTKVRDYTRKGTLFTWLESDEGKQVASMVSIDLWGEAPKLLIPQVMVKESLLAMLCWKEEIIHLVRGALRAEKPN